VIKKNFLRDLTDMKRILIAALVVAASMEANATPVSWELVDFQFNDGGAAYGSFIYDSDTNQLSNIDIHTTAGSILNGRHFFSTAGVWGSTPEYGVLAFSDTSGPDFTGAGWFLIDANIDFNAFPGTIANQSLAVGAESFCINYSCWSAANEITNPGQSRNTISGYLVASVPVPEPETYAMMLTGLGLVGFGARRKNKNVA
jgi:hypothetical protein